MKVLVKKEKGVSEVVGSLLVLAITVTLFSSVFYYVSTIPSPTQHTYSQFGVKMNIVSANTTHYANITIKNLGGEALQLWRTELVVIFNGTAYHHYLSYPEIAKQLPKSVFNVGDQFYYNSSWDNVSVTYNTTISAYLFDSVTHQIIWSGSLQGPTTLLPVVVGLITSPSPLANNMPATFTAIVIDPQHPSDVDTYSVSINVSSLGLGSNNNIMYYAGSNKFVYSSVNPIAVTISTAAYFNVTIKVVDPQGHVVIDNESVMVGKVVTANPNLAVSKIQLSNPSPTHGQSVLVTVYIQNSGGTGAMFNMSIFEQRDPYYVSTPTSEYLIKSSLGNPITNNIVAAGGETTISFVWDNVGTNSSGVYLHPVPGTHWLVIKLTNITAIGTTNTYPDVYNELNITVLPKILLVNNDQATAGSVTDVISYYTFDLGADDFSFTLQTVSGNNVIPVSTLLQYDVVIWTTGYDDIYPVSTLQLNNLLQFFEQGGSIWLISPETTAFTSAWANIGLSVSVTSPLTSITNVTQVPNTAIDLTLPNHHNFTAALVDRTNYGVQANIISSYSGFKPLLLDSDGNTVAVYSDLTGNPTYGKFVYFSFEFSKIDPVYLQNFLSYRIINWFINTSSLTGTDLAAADMIFSTLNPLYHQVVTITVAVRNNGQNTVDSVDVALYMDNQLLNTKSDPVSVGPITAMGNFILVNFSWVATVPGKHVFSVMVDPYDMLGEVNRINNAITGNVLPVTVSVQFSTLIVNNATYSSSTNALIQAFKVLGYRYTYLDLAASYTLPDGYNTGEYFSNFNLVIWVGGTKPDALGTTDSIDAHALLAYVQQNNGGVWFLGSQIGTALSNAMLTSTQSLLSALAVRENSTVSAGNNVYFGINYITGGDNITRGMALKYSGASAQFYAPTGYAVFASMYSADTSIHTLSTVYQKLYNAPVHAGYGVRGTWGSSKFEILPFDYDAINGIFAPHTQSYLPWNEPLQAQSWLLYEELKWYGLEDARTQLEVSPIDIHIAGSTENVPVIGHTYTISATITNIGFKGTSVLIRFYQDYEIIGAQNIYIKANSMTTAEVLWTPVFAGANRHIRVVIDPFNQLQQIMPNGSYPSQKLFNFLCEGIDTLTIYYFWDNMEFGNRNWNTETTLVNINGEGPLSFLSSSNVYTNVIYQINTTLSKNYALTQNFSYSPPNSYYLREVAASNITYKPPLDLAFVIDFSGSMKESVSPSNTAKYVLVQRAFSDLIWNETGPKDRVVVFIFTTGSISSEFTQLAVLQGFSNIYMDKDGFMYMSDTNKSILTNALNNTRPDGGTPFWSTVGEAVNYTLTYGRSSTQAQKAIISMTDGDDNGIYNGTNLNLGYSPHGIWGKEIYYNGASFTGGFTKYKLNDATQYAYFQSRTTLYADWYTDSSYTYWFTDFADANEYYENPFPALKGLLFAPVPIFTIGIGVQPVNPLYNNTAGYNSPLNWTEQTDSSTDAQSYYMSAAGDLWNVAWSTGARYFYTDTGTDLPQIFTGIVTSISTSPGGTVLSRHPAPITSNIHQPFIPKPEAIKEVNGQYLIFSDGFELGSLYDYDYYGYTYSDIYGYNNIFGKGWWVPYNSQGSSFRWSQPSWSISSSTSYYGTRSLELTLSNTGTIYNIWSPRILADGFTAMDLQFYVYMDSSPSTATLTINAYSPWDFDTYGNLLNPLYSQTLNLSKYYSVNGWTLVDLPFNLIAPPVGTLNAADNGMIWFEFTVNTHSDSGYNLYFDNVSVYGTLSTALGYGKPPLPPGPAPSTAALNIVSYRTLVTQPFSLVGVTSATLSFWQKYWALTGENGGVITVGVYKHGTWMWKYVMPERPYTGNLNLSKVPDDSYGDPMTWAYNGASASGTFGWEFVKVNLDPFIGNSMVAINFTFYQFAVPLQKNPFYVYRGWYIDNIKVEVSGGAQQYWHLTSAAQINEATNSSFYDHTLNSAYGHYWMFNSSTGDTLPLGVDSALITKQIDLTNAYNATLSAWFKFNLNPASGLPPEIIRVEVSNNNGQSWSSITYGVRIGWGYSGEYPAGTDGKSYSGVNTSGYGWVDANTLERLSVDLSGWAGQTILLQFRVVTNSLASYQSYASSTYPQAIFIDDVSIYGASLAAVTPIFYF